MPKQGEPEASTVTMDEICDTFDTLFWDFLVRTAHAYAVRT